MYELLPVQYIFRFVVSVNIIIFLPWFILETQLSHPNINYLHCEYFQTIVSQQGGKYILLLILISFLIYLFDNLRKGCMNKKMVEVLSRNNINIVITLSMSGLLDIRISME